MNRRRRRGLGAAFRNPGTKQFSLLVYLPMDVTLRLPVDIGNPMLIGDKGVNRKEERHHEKHISEMGDPDGPHYPVRRVFA